MQFTKSIINIRNKSKEVPLTFDDLYKNYYIDIRNYISKLSGSWCISEEITQDVFIKLYKNFDKISHNNIRGWLYTVAHNETINYFKKNSKPYMQLDENTKDSSNDPYNKLEDYKTRKFISETLIKLPKKQAQAILLKDMYGYSYDEISNILQISYRAVKSLIYRGRQNFIKYYSEVTGDEL